MCGVIGIAAVGELDKKEERLRQEVMIFLSTELLLLTQPRGKEATGMAALFGNNDYIGLKMGVPAADFISRLGGTKEDFDGFMKLWRGKKNPCKMFIGHCRQPTTGGGAPPEDNENNHPIKIGNTIGVHNGTLKNDDIVFKNLGCKRDGKVDSEAIFRLADRVIDGGNQPWTTDGLLEVAHHLEGTFTVLMFHANNPYQFVAMRDGRPLEAVYIKPFKLMVLASDKDYLKGVLFKYNKFAAITNFGISGLPVLHKKDLIWRVMPDRSTFLMDIRHEPEQENPTISDFFSEGTIKYESQRDWQTPTKTYNNPHTNRHQQGAWPNNTGKGTKNTTAASGSGVKKAEVNASTSDTNKDSKKEGQSTDEDKESKRNRPAGFVWQNEPGSFVPVGGKVSDRQAAGLKNVEMDAESNKVEELPGEIIMDAENQESAEEILDVKKSPAAERCSHMPSVKLLPSKTAIPERFPQREEAKILVVDTKRAEAGADDNIFEASFSELDSDAAAHMDAIRKEVKVETRDPEVSKLAQDFANSLERFETEEEVIDALGIVDVETLRQIQAQHITNRIIRTFAAKHFYEGYMRAKTEEAGPSTTLQRLRKELQEKSMEGDRLTAVTKDKKNALRINEKLHDKKQASELRVRVLKNFCMLLLEFIEDRAFALDPPDAYSQIRKPFKDIIFEKILAGKEIDFDKLNMVFTKGDKINLPIINTVLRYIGELEDNDLRLREESLNGQA